jgi:hypothetical protein
MQTPGPRQHGFFQRGLLQAGLLQIDPPPLESRGNSGPWEIVVPFTEWAVTVAVIERAVTLTAKLDAHLMLLAVHTVPYPLPFGCPAAAHARLVEQLIDLAGRSPLPVNPQVVVARSFTEGFRHALKPESTILLGTRRRFWKTAEQRMAESLAADGHHVALVHIEPVPVGGHI